MNTGVPGQDFPGSDLGMAVQVVQCKMGVSVHFLSKNDNMLVIR